VNDIFIFFVAVAPGLLSERYSGTRHF